jgi:hypothetical protein
MEPPSKEIYYKSILRLIELYQLGRAKLEDLESIPKKDLLDAMRQECQRISQVCKERNKELFMEFQINNNQN